VGLIAVLVGGESSIGGAFRSVQVRFLAENQINCVREEPNWMQKSELSARTTSHAASPRVAYILVLRSSSYCLGELHHRIGDIWGKKLPGCDDGRCGADLGNGVGWA
jgi:hypothetical protein